METANSANTVALKHTHGENESLYQNIHWAYHSITISVKTQSLQDSPASVTLQQARTHSFTDNRSVQTLPQLCRPVVRCAMSTRDTIGFYYEKGCRRSGENKQVFSVLHSITFIIISKYYRVVCIVSYVSYRVCVFVYIKFVLSFSTFNMPHPPPSILQKCIICI